ncbi:MAG: glycosyltransferase family 39 protein [Microcoleaceae cyanobacterium]
MKLQKKELLILSIILLFGIVNDRLWFALDKSVPSWDQADYLTGSLNYFYFLQSPQFFSQEWCKELWMLSPKVPPLTYLLTVPFLAIFGTSPDTSPLVYLLFSAILLYSVYGIARQLFNSKIGLWAAALCTVFPGLYVYRLQFLLDYPLIAMVTFCFYCLTMWRSTIDQKQADYSLLKSWRWTILLGVSLGLAVLVKQTAIFFLFFPFLWLGINILKYRKWQDLLQLLSAVLLSIIIVFPWARTNWLLMLTSGKRATIDSAIAEGDPALNTIEAWTYYWNLLPQQISWLLLIIPLVGLLLFGIKTQLKTSEQKIYSFQWLFVFLIGGYLLCSLNINKDFRYSLPLLPVFSIILAYGLVCWPKHWGKMLRWTVLILAIISMEVSLWPVGGKMIENIVTIINPKGEYQAYLGSPFPHQQVINQIIKTEPYLQSTLGVLPSTPTINQHNINYFGALKNNQVHGRQVGTRIQDVFKDAVSLSWFLTKTDEQGSVGRISKAQAAIVQEVEQGVQFKLQQQWQLRDESTLNLYYRKLPYFEVKPLTTTDSKLELKQLLLPAKVPPGLPIPVTYIWSGAGEQLKSGLILLTWQIESQNQVTSRWLHDHKMAMGFLYPAAIDNQSDYQIIERMGMLPPENTIPGIYSLKATYLNPETGETYPIKTPNTTVEITPEAAALPAPELDLITQLRQLAQQLPKGMIGLEPIFEEIARINQYDPTQDYLRQAEQSLTYRLQQEPNNLELAYSLVLATVLQQDAEAAITALNQVVKLDSNNAFAHAYLAFVYLYNWQPKAAEMALKPALMLQPNQPEFKLLRDIAKLMQGNLKAGLRLLNN